MDLTTYGKPCEHSQVSREHRERGTRTVRTFPRVPWKWNGHDTTVAFSANVNHKEKKIEEKAGRHIDDFPGDRTRNRTSHPFLRRHETT